MNQVLPYPIFSLPVKTDNYTNTEIDTDADYNSIRINNEIKD